MVIVKRIISSFVVLQFAISAFCQPSDNFASLKNFIPPSPEAQAMSRYGEIPVDLSTGIPSISIPIYEVRSRTLSLPISLSYHASGVKVEDISTPVGLGWVLNAGGQVSRSVVGKPDENGFLNMTGYKSRNYFIDLQYVSSPSDMYYLNSMANGTYDTQSDIYNFNLGLVSGRFVYDTSYTIHYTPADRQIIIQRPSNMFKIIDDEGTTYELTVTDTTETTAQSPITTWHLTRMISADKTDTISFQYNSASNFVDTSRSYYLSIIAPRVNGSTYCELQATSYQLGEQQNWVNHRRKLLDRITFSNGYVKFEYATDREDGIPERLKEVSVYDASDNLIKRAKLYHDYFGTGNTKRLKLTKVGLTGVDTTEQQPFSFIYDESATMPSRKSAEMDYWGYYNGNGAASLLPANFENYIHMFLSAAGYFFGTNNHIIQAYLAQSGDRYVNPDFTQAYVLKTIKYPTGGSTRFEFENNTGYPIHGDSRDLVGGLRIKRIINTDSVSGRQFQKSYKYDSVALFSPILPDDFYFHKRGIYHNETTASYCYTIDFYANANPISALIYYNGSPVLYHKLTEFIGDSIVNMGKTEYLYEWESDSTYGLSEIQKYWNFSTDRSWARGQLLATRYFKNESGSFSLVKEIKNYYEAKARRTAKVGQVCELMTNVYGTTLENFMNAIYNIPDQEKYYLSHFDYIDVVVPIGVKKLIKTEETDYLNNAITQKQELFYQSQHHLYPTLKLVYTSTGDTLKEITKYPQDKATIANLPSAASVALDSMISRNIRMVPAEVEAYENGKLLTRNRIDYKNWESSNRYYQEFLNTQYEGNAMEQRVQYKGYDDRGNVTNLSLINGQDVSYIWDYNKSYPIAQVTNASLANIAFTSFESEGKGNWTFNGTPSTDATSPSGSKAYGLIGGSISRSGLGSLTYVVSYWSKNGAQSVNGSAGVVGRSIDGWTYYEHSVTNPSSGLITVSGTGTIDELRLYPKGSFMTTYNYRPLVGLISQADINNRMTYFYYDNLNRLVTVKDQDKNVIRKISYGFTESVGHTITYYNQQRSGTYRRNNCGSGYQGTDVVLTVQAGVHSSTVSVAHANTLADAYIGANGQAYANTNGSCQVLYSNVVKSGNFTRNNCTSGYSGTIVTYTVAAGTYTSIISQAYVDNLAQADVDNYGQQYANLNGLCYISCGSPSCTSPAHKCINSMCELGAKVYTNTYYDTNLGQWVCTYHYQWSDSSVSGDFYEYSSQECELDN